MQENVFSVFSVEDILQLREGKAFMESNWLKISPGAFLTIEGSSEILF